MKIIICIIFILAICGMNVVSADTMCESLHSYDAEKGMQALQKSLKMVEPLLNTDCYTEQDLCDAIAFTIEKMMSHADRIVNASTVTTDNGKCRKCNMNKLYDFAVEADSAIEFLRRKGYSYRGISHVQRYDQLTRTTSRCNEEYAYPGPGIPAGPTVVVKKPFKDTRKKKNPWAKIMGWEDCDEIFRRMEAGEQVEPNNCGLTKDVARGGLPKHKTSQKKQSVPDKPSWSNGCVENNAKNSGGARAIWTQCALSLCARTRLVCADSQDNMWVSTHVNENEYDYDDDDWEYVVRVNSGEPNAIGMYPRDSTIDVIDHSKKAKTYYGRVEKIE